MNLILMQAGYPPVIIKTQDKANYLAALRQADAGLLEPFTVYIAQNLLHSLEIMLRGARGESIEEPDDLDKRLALLASKLKGAGQKIEIVRSKGVILNLFDASLKPLLTQLLQMYEKFSQFYVKSDLGISLSGVTTFWALGQAKQGLARIRDDLAYSHAEGPSYIELSVIYVELLYQGFNNTNFSPDVRFTFNLTRYTIGPGSWNAHNLWHEKLYSESLTEAEMAAIVQAEAQRHEAFIESQLAALQASQKQ